MAHRSKLTAVVSARFAAMSRLGFILVQGIVNPLMVQKTDKRGGTIVNSPAAQAAAAAEAAPPAKKAKVSLRKHGIAVMHLLWLNSCSPRSCFLSVLHVSLLCKAILWTRDKAERISFLTRKVYKKTYHYK